MNKIATGHLKMKALAMVKGQVQNVNTRCMVSCNVCKETHGNTRLFKRG